MRKIFQQREELGMYNTLVQELRLHESEFFFRYVIVGKINIKKFTNFLFNIKDWIYMMIHSTTGLDTRFLH